jgi:N4-gp56 family major capsid protein
MVSLTTGLTQVMQTFYDKKFLDRAKAELRHDFGAQVKNHKMNMGKVVRFTRFTPLALATTALTENTEPSAVDMTATNVDATLTEYGNYTIVSSLFSATSIDDNLEEHVDIHGTNAGETIDAIIRNVLSAGATAQIVAGKALTAVAATDTLTGLEIRKAVRTLKQNKAKRFESGYFRGIIQPFQSMDLMGNSEWLSAYQYTSPDSDAIKKGVIGKIHGVEFVESNQGSTEASTVTIYHTFIFGQNAYGVVRLESMTDPKVYIGQGVTTTNPLNMRSTVGWRMPFTAVVLNANWIICVKTGATA